MEQSAVRSTLASHLFSASTAEQPAAGAEEREDADAAEPRDAAAAALPGAGRGAGPADRGPRARLRPRPGAALPAHQARPAGGGPAADGRDQGRLGQR